MPTQRVFFIRIFQRGNNLVTDENVVIENKLANEKKVKDGGKEGKKEKKKENKGKGNEDKSKKKKVEEKNSSKKEEKKKENKDKMRAGGKRGK